MIHIGEYIKKTTEVIEKRLDLLIPETDTHYNKLFQAARYSLLSGGKRLRPLLTLATTEVFSGNKEAALVPACALEMIHTYSLIHDDLPCMDNDDYRRGKPTLHKVYTDADALLAGDFLLTHAFESLSHAPHLTNEQKLSLISTLSQRSGGNGMIAGQVMDMHYTGKEISPEILQQIHRCKTGALLTAAIEFGGIIAHANHHMMNSLREFGWQIGLAFQIIDDILDVTASKQKHGKDHSSDKVNNKMTYLTLFGYDQAKIKAQELLHASLKTLENLPAETSLLASIAKLLIERQS
jgi:geranylgeranyl diphosphate synthase type II